MSPISFFAAANTDGGFSTLFDEIFSPAALSRIYILKGGPGTGKSTLMKSIAFAAEAMGEDVEYYYCSSDTDSLDGIILRARKTAVIDGTAPHVRDPLYPGAVERIVNLGDAFDAAGLEKESEILKLLAEKKHRAYRAAYRYLSAAGALLHQRDETAGEAFLYAKARAAAERLTLRFSCSEKGEISHRYLSAIGTKGICHLDTLEKAAKMRVAVTNPFGLGYAFMNLLYAALLRMGVAAMVCFAPPVSTHIEGIYIGSEGVFFYIGEDAETADKKINVLRFADKECISSRRAALRRLEKGIEAMTAGALAAFADAGAYHADAEKIYGKHVDFSRVDAMRDRMMHEIFANNV